MAEMIERVAEAIGAAFAGQQERLVEAALAVDGSLSPVADEIMAICARAAIEAMREPTEAMMWAGDNVYEQERDSFMGPAPVPMWRAMIDKALKPETTT